MIKKSIIWFLVLVFLNFVIMPDFVSAGGMMVGDKGKADTIIIGTGLVLTAIIIAAVLIKHSDKKKELLKDQAHDNKISSGIHLDYQSSTQMSYEPKYDDQLITPSGLLVLHMW